MRLSPCNRALLLATLNICASQACFAQQSQQKPLARTFVAGTEERYQVTVALRVETHGVSTEKVGDKTYADFYTHEATGQVSWRSTRKVKSLDTGGIASLDESLDHIESACDGNPGAKTFDAKLQKSVLDSCSAWRDLSTLEYQEDQSGLFHGLADATATTLGPDSSLLSLWARRAFRPSVVLPNAPLHFGDHAAHRIENSSADRSKPQGEEFLEWLEAPGDSPAATLHVSQSLSWIDTGNKHAATKVGTRPEPRNIFYADSLNTISLLDGSLLKASRSATHETKEALDMVPGLPEAPTFGSKLTITVTILRLP